MNIKVRLNKMRVDSEQYPQDCDGFIHLPVADDCKISDLFGLFGISDNGMMGKVVLINSKPCQDIETAFHNDDVIEIFKLIAGG
jgi:sulfur carrier protein ThiS